VYLSSILHDTLEAWKENREHIAIVSDNASNIVAANQILERKNVVEESLRCAIHTLQLAIKVVFRSFIILRFSESGCQF